MDVTQVFAAVAASAAALVDVYARRIPNWLSGAALAAGLLIHAWQGSATGWQGSASGVLLALAGAALGMLILLPLYAIRAMGAGDVKLLAGLGALVGPQLLVSVAVYAAVAGGVISLFVLARRHRLPVFFRDVLVLRRPPTRSGATAPYAVAIASGVYLSLLLPSVVR
jgi:prepilin peptidase CpaA